MVRAPPARDGLLRTAGPSRPPREREKGWGINPVRTGPSPALGWISHPVLPGDTPARPFTHIPGGLSWAFGHSATGTPSPVPILELLLDCPTRGQEHGHRGANHRRQRVQSATVGRAARAAPGPSDTGRPATAGTGTADAGARKPAYGRR